MPQRLAIYLFQHPPSSDKPLVVTLIIILVVKYQPLNKHLMWTIPSGIPKLSQSQARVVGDASPNAK